MGYLLFSPALMELNGFLSSLNVHLMEISTNNHGDSNGNYRPVI